DATDAVIRWILCAPKVSLWIGGRAMPEFEVQTLLTTPLVEVRDVLCAGTCRHKGDIERSARTTLVFPYRGTYVRHVGDEDAVADASQVLFFHAGEDYQ